MSLNIKEEVLHVESLVGENTAQTVLQTTLDIPSASVSIERIVWLKGKPVITNSMAALDKVTAEGYIDLTMVYTGEDFVEEQVEYQKATYRQAITFSDYVEVIGAEEEMPVQVQVQILGIEWELQSDQHTVNVDVLIELTARVKQQSAYNVVTRASIQSPKKLSVDEGIFNTRSLLKQTTASITLNEEIELPEGSEPLKKVLEHSIRPHILEAATGPEQITVAGELEVSLLYENDNGEIQCCDLDKLIPFELNVPNELKTSELIVKPYIFENFNIDFTPPSSTFSLAGELEFRLDLYISKHIRVVYDLSCSGGCMVETRKSRLMLDSLVNEKTQQNSVQGVIELSTGYPPIREVLKSEGKIQQFDYRIDEDKVFIEGSLSIDIAYLAYSEDEPKQLYRVLFNNAIPFQYMAAIGGVAPGMLADVELVIDQIHLDLINRETVEADVSIRSQIAVTEPIQQEIVVEAIEVPAAVEDPPSVTYVFVNNKDTLWKLAKQYHTSVEAIVDTNSWLRERESLELASGDKLCILRS